MRRISRKYITSDPFQVPTSEDLFEPSPWRWLRLLLQVSKTLQRFPRNLGRRKTTGFHVDLWSETFSSILQTCRCQERFDSPEVHQSPLRWTWCFLKTLLNSLRLKLNIVKIWFFKRKVANQKLSEAHVLIECVMSSTHRESLPVLPVVPHRQLLLIARSHPVIN